jgi:hypothetical protein
LPVIRFASVGAEQSDPCLNRHKGPLALEADVSVADFGAPTPPSAHLTLNDFGPGIRENENENRRPRQLYGFITGRRASYPAP